MAQDWLPEDYASAAGAAAQSLKAARDLLIRAQNAAGRARRSGSATTTYQREMTRCGELEDRADEEFVKVQEFLEGL